MTESKLLRHALLFVDQFYMPITEHHTVRFEADAAGNMQPVLYEKDHPAAGCIELTVTINGVLPAAARPPGEAS